MKKIFDKKIIFGIVLGGIIFGGIVYAATYYAKDVYYQPSDSSWKVSNVNDAINSLYSIVKESESSYYTLSSAITSAGTDTYGTYSIIEFTYTNIEGYNKVQKLPTDKTGGNSGERTNLICYTTRGEKVIVAGVNDVGTYDISNCRILKISYLYYQRDKYIINLPKLLSNEGRNYTLSSSITLAGTDTYDNFSIIEFTYSNIEGYNKVQKLPTDKTGGSGERTALTCYKSNGESVTIAGVNDAGTYNISGCATLKMSYIYYQCDKYTINLPNLLP